MTRPAASDALHDEAEINSGNSAEDDGDNTSDEEEIRREPVPDAYRLQAPFATVHPK